MIEEFHYQTDIAPLGEVYNVVALPNHADCFVPNMNMTLSKLYEEKPDWFECETEQLPIRVNILDPMYDLSIQIHPDDDFAKTYNGVEENRKLGHFRCTRRWIYRIWALCQN